MMDAARNLTTTPRRRCQAITRIADADEADHNLQNPARSNDGATMCVPASVLFQLAMNIGLWVIPGRSIRRRS